MKEPKRPLLLLGLSCIAIYFVNLDVWHVNIMEARNFISAREMLTDSNWLLPTLNGQARYQKPPLPTWITAISATVFGFKNIAALRLPAAIMAVIMIFTSYFFVFKLARSKMLALISAMCLASSFLIVFAGRNGQWDVFTHAFMLLGIYQLFQIFTQSTQQIKRVLLAGLFVGLSCMSKGPVSVYTLLIPFLISFGIVYKFNFNRKKWLFILLFLLIACFLASWWYYYVYVNDQETFLAITKRETANWTSKNVRPFYYYWSFFVQSGVWTILALVSLLYPYLKNKVVNKKAYAFTVLWTLISVVLLSIIPEKKSRYLLPVMIPLAFNLGFYLEYLFRSFKTINSSIEKVPVYLHFGLIGLIGVLFPFAGYFYFDSKLDGNWIWFVLLSVVLFGMGLFVLRNLFGKELRRAFYGTIIMICAVMLFGMPMSKAVFTNTNFTPLSEISAWEAKTKNTTYEFAVISVEMVWSYGKKLPVIKRDDVITIPSEKTFGVLVSEEQRASFLKTFANYSVEKIKRFDMNTVPEGNDTYRTRLWRDFYVVNLN